MEEIRQSSAGIYKILYIMEAGFPISIVSKTEQNFGNLWISRPCRVRVWKNFQKSKPWPRSCLQPLHKSMKDGVHLLLPRTTNVTTLNPGGTTHFTAKKTAVLKPNPPEHQSQNPPNLDHLVTTMGLDIFGNIMQLSYMGSQRCQRLKLEVFWKNDPNHQWYLSLPLCASAVWKQAVDGRNLAPLGMYKSL